MSMTEKLQILWLFVLAAPIACVAWTVTHEEVFTEIREWCVRKSEQLPHACTSESSSICSPVNIASATTSRPRWCWSPAIGCCCPTGAARSLAWFTLVWVANIYMSLFGRLRLDIKRERVEIKAEELVVEREEATTPAPKARELRPAAAAPPPERPARRA